MSTSTLTQLIARARSRADMPLAGFVTDTDVTNWLNEGIQLLHERMAMAFAENYVLSTTTITLIPGQEIYALPTDFFKLYGIDYQIGQYTYSLLPYMFPERNMYKAANQQSLALGGVPPRYNIRNTSISILPIPIVGTTITVHYAPQATALVAPSDSYTVPDGWERYVILYAAKQMLMKEESSVVDISREIAAQDQQLDEIIANRDSGAPKQVVDMDYVNLYPLWGTYYGY